MKCEIVVTLTTLSVYIMDDLDLDDKTPSHLETTKTQVDARVVSISNSFVLCNLVIPVKSDPLDFGVFNLFFPP